MDAIHTLSSIPSFEESCASGAAGGRGNVASAQRSGGGWLHSLVASLGAILWWIANSTYSLFIILSYIVFIFVAPYLIASCFKEWFQQGCHKYPFVSELAYGRTEIKSFNGFCLAATSFMVVVADMTCRNYSVLKTDGNLSRSSSLESRSSSSDSCSNATVNSQNGVLQRNSGLKSQGSSKNQKASKLFLLLNLFILLSSWGMGIGSLGVAFFRWAHDMHIHVGFVALFFVSSGLFFTGHLIGCLNRTAELYGVCGGGRPGSNVRTVSQATVPFLKSILIPLALSKLYGIYINHQEIPKCTSYYGGGVRVAQNYVLEGQFGKACITPLLVGCPALEEMTRCEYGVIIGVWCLITFETTLFLLQKLSSMVQSRLSNILEHRMETCRRSVGAKTSLERSASGPQKTAPVGGPVRRTISSVGSAEKTGYSNVSCEPAPQSWVSAPNLLQSDEGEIFSNKQK